MLATTIPTDWSNLSALACLIALVFWAMTKGLPSPLARQAQDSAEARKDFQQSVGRVVNECAQQRQEFRDELGQQRQAAKEEAATMRAAFAAMVEQQREHSAALAHAGHNALDGLANEIALLRGQIDNE